MGTLYRVTHLGPSKCEFVKVERFTLADWKAEKIPGQPYGNSHHYFCLSIWPVEWEDNTGLEKAGHKTRIPADWWFKPTLSPIQHTQTHGVREVDTPDLARQNEYPFQHPGAGKIQFTGTQLTNHASGLARHSNSPGPRLPVSTTWHGNDFS